MTVVNYGGIHYDETTDWRALLRRAKEAGEQGADCIPAYVPPYAGQTFLLTGHENDLETRLEMLAAALAGTPMELQLAEAALELLEDGLRTDDRSALRIANALPYRLAPQVTPRLLALWSQLHHRLAPEHRDRLLGELLEAGPDHPEVQQLAISVLRTEADTEPILIWAARHIPEWLADNLRELRPDVDRAFDLMVLEAPPEHRRRLVAAIVALGEPYRDALVQQLSGPYLTDAQRDTLRAELRAHPAFAWVRLR